jgi:hypothetical protein
MHPRCLLVAAFLYSALAFCQKPEYDFYTEFRNTWNPKVRAESPSATDQQIAEKYAARLNSPCLNPDFCRDAEPARILASTESLQHAAEGRLMIWVPPKITKNPHTGVEATLDTGC